jgi:uncharacterized protein (TIGR03435 family)
MESAVMFHMKTAAQFVIPLLISFTCVAQSPASRIAFDAASVRPSATAGNEDPHIETSPGSLIIRGMSLKFCISWAYSMPPYQVDGPAWLKDAGFDISAKAAQPVDDDHLRLMLRTLLAERFGVKVHSEQKEMQLYALTVSKGGIKFQESATEGPLSHSRDRDGTNILQRASMNELAQELSGPLKRPVIDATGLKGRYDFRINTLPYVEAAASVNGGKGDQVSDLDLAAILVTALQNELGLKLESRRDKADILVVDHAEKTPTEN